MIGAVNSLAFTRCLCLCLYLCLCCGDKRPAVIGSPLLYRLPGAAHRTSPDIRNRTHTMPSTPPVPPQPEHLVRDGSAPTRTRVPLPHDPSPTHLKRGPRDSVPTMSPEGASLDVQALVSENRMLRGDADRLLAAQATIRSQTAQLATAHSDVSRLQRELSDEKVVMALEATRVS